MEIKRIIDNKLPLMGLAALCILFAHFNLGDNLVWLQRCFSWAVELFLILSGIGCYFSIQKRTTLQFYWKRLIRVIPPYLIILLAYAVYNCKFLGTPVDFFFMHNEAFISMFAFGEITGWFFVEIVIGYLLTPLFNKILKKNYIYFIWVIIGILVLTAQLEFYTTGVFYMVNNFIIVRIPAYMIGMLLGYVLSKNKEAKMPEKLAYLCEIACIICTIANMIFNNINFGLIFKIINLPLAFFTVLILTNKVNKLPSFLNIFGAISLETYLVYEKVLNTLVYDFRPSINVLIANILAVLITTIIAIILKLISNVIFTKKLKLY